MRLPTQCELSNYRGCKLFIDHYDILVVTPDGEIACFHSMARVRGWVRRHIRARRALESTGGDHAHSLSGDLMARARASGTAGDEATALLDVAVRPSA
jgi:hypothetical protein